MQGEPATPAVNAKQLCYRSGPDLEIFIGKKNTLYAGRVSRA
jgi:hypothetical protein